MKTTSFKYANTISRNLRLALPIFAAVAGLAGSTSAADKVAQPGVDLRESEDAPNKINGALLTGAKVSKFSATEIPQSAFTREEFKRDKPRDAEPKTRPRKMSARLEKMLASGKAGDSIVVVIKLNSDGARVPRFPEPAVTEARSSATNKRAFSRTNALIRDLTARRQRDQAETAKLFSQRYKAEPIESFWLVNAMSVRMPLGLVREVAGHPAVAFVEPDDTGTIPPQNANANDDTADGRGRMVSDPYFALGLRSGWIGLLDTGARFTHILFNAPSQIDFRRDCINGGANCNTGPALNPNDDCWDHGTSSAAIITANGRGGDAFRGVSAITLDSFKVYPTTFDTAGTCNGNLSVTASVRGFQTAVSVLDRVIVAEMQAGGSDTGTISAAADAAFDAGAVIIAANGNNGPGANTVNEPAIAHKVIGVGNFDVQTQTQIASQSRGPAPDNRFKPDIQTPTNAETASNGCGWRQNCTTGGSDTAYGNFGGTSGATPFAAGAAALLRNWLRGTGSIDPGQVYAQLILSGQQPYPFNNTSGAGPLRLPTDGWAWWGRVSVSDGGTINIPLNISGTGANTFDGALWWPETAAQAHNDVDLSLIDPSGTARAFSVSVPSVFERARVAGRVANGVWTLRVRGYRVPAGPQNVYWAAHVRLR